MIKRPKVTHGESKRFRMSCGNLYITTGHNEEGVLIEIFAILGKAGGCASCQNEALTRSISLGLKYGLPIEEYVKQLIGISCPGRGMEDGIEIHSCAEAISIVLNEEIKKETNKEVESNNGNN